MVPSTRFFGPEDPPGQTLSRSENKKGTISGERCRELKGSGAVVMEDEGLMIRV
jgi:hypothetical protein